MFWTKNGPTAKPDPPDDWTSENVPAGLMSKAQHRAMKRYRDLLIRTSAAKANAHERFPRTECRKCHSLFADGYGGWLFKHLCSTCDCEALERLVGRIVDLHGRKKTRKILKKLTTKSRRDSHE